MICISRSFAVVAVFDYCLEYNNKKLAIKNQIFHNIRWITRKRVTSWRGNSASSPRHCARATQLLSKKCRSDGEPLATLCPIWPARDLNLRPPAPETNALPLDQLAGARIVFKIKLISFFTAQAKFSSINEIVLAGALESASTVERNFPGIYSTVYTHSKFLNSRW